MVCPSIQTYPAIWSKTETLMETPVISSPHKVMFIAHLSTGEVLGCSTDPNIDRTFGSQRRGCSIGVSAPNSTLGYANTNLTMTVTMPISSSESVVGATLLAPAAMTVSAHRAEVSATPVIAVEVGGPGPIHNADVFGDLTLVQRDTLADGRTVTVDSVWPASPMTYDDVSPTAILRADLASNWTAAVTHAKTYTRTGPADAVTVTVTLRVPPSPVTYQRASLELAIFSLPVLLAIGWPIWIVTRWMVFSPLVRSGYLRARAVKQKDV